MYIDNLKIILFSKEQSLDIIEGQINSCIFLFTLN